MEKNTNSVKANRILYIVIVAVLCITAIVIGITAAMQRGKKTENNPITTTSPAITTKAPAVTTNLPSSSEDEGADTPTTLPSFVAPTEGTVEKEHDLSVLVYSATMDDMRVHCGIDISTGAGADVLATADGTVSKIYTDPMMGYCIEITHAGDAVSVYKNLAQAHAEGISEGVKVKSGQLISYVGDSAMIESADESHLHYELKIKGVSVDPMEYISEDSRLTSLTQGDIYEG